MTQTELTHQRYYDDIRRYAIRVTGNASDADDVAQETFYRFLKSESDCPKDQQRNYLYRIARNFMIDSFRKEKRIKRYSGDPQNDIIPCLADEKSLDPARTAMQNDSADQVRKTIQQSAPLVQEILRLRYNENMKTKDIAFVMNLGHSNVRKILSQTISQLSEQMGGKGE